MLTAVVLPLLTAITGVPSCMASSGTIPKCSFSGVYSTAMYRYYCVEHSSVDKQQWTNHCTQAIEALPVAVCRSRVTSSPGMDRRNTTLQEQPFTLAHCTNYKLTPDWSTQWQLLLLRQPLFDHVILDFLVIRSVLLYPQVIPYSNILTIIINHNSKQWEYTK